MRLVSRDARWANKHVDNKWAGPSLASHSFEACCLSHGMWDTQAQGWVGPCGPNTLNKKNSRNCVERGIETPSLKLKIRSIGGLFQHLAQIKNFFKY